jgi:hypothetical protein
MPIEWEAFEGTRGSAPRDMYGPVWTVTPCLAVTASGVTLNRPALKTFGIDAGMSARVAFSKDGNMIGIRMLSGSEDHRGSMLVKRCPSNGKISKSSAYITTNAFAKRIERFRGHVCELVMERESHMIIAMLDSPVHVYVPNRAPKQSAE